MADLVLYLSFDENGGITAHDQSGNGNDGTLLPLGSEPMWTDGVIGKALSFDGISDYIQVANSDSLDMQYLSISCWIKPSVISGIRMIVSKDDYWGANVQYGVYMSDSYLRFYAKTTTGFKDVVSSESIFSVDVWYLIVVTLDGVNCRFYIDGVLEDTISFSGTLLITTDKLLVGAVALGSLYFFGGVIDEVRIFNRALSADEIKELYQSAYSGTLRLKQVKIVRRGIP